MYHNIFFEKTSIFSSVLKSRMDSNGLFNIARYRPTEAPEKNESKKNSMLERARQRALKRKLEAEKNAETISVADSVDSEKSSSSESESEIEEDKKSEVSEVASDFQILEDVAALRRKKLRLDLPKWCQEPIIIEDVESKLIQKTKSEGFFQYSPA